ncbi:hypothetical protein [Sphingobacterium thalpophilum]|uniref:hypothetical protein n=1 Tax=Sphingobacterium thalpophilum TaxID=259 RepID=UPI0024A63B11|nr:hypothetical protein [Sphingobacterium thalpophilum]
MKRFIIASCVWLLFATSCKKEISSDQIAADKAKMDYPEYISRVFAKALGDKQIRNFIREEALKKFDNDYDVLYQLVKDNKLENGETFAEVLESYADDRVFFRKSLENQPLLTIYVPELEKFSAESWNITSEIPLVAVRNLSEKKAGKPLLAYDAKGIIRELSYNEEPNFPVVVLKSNERVTVVNNEEINKAASIRNSRKKDALANTKKGGIYFIDDHFDNIRSSISSVDTKKLAGNQKGPKASTSTYGYAAANGKHQMFFNFAGDDPSFPNYVGSPTMFNAAYKQYQRDYIYYNINNLTDTGRFNNSHVESIYSISVNQNASKGYIVDDLRDWTDGILEIKVHVSFVNRTGGFESLYKIFPVSANELFKKEINIDKPRVYYLPDPIKLVGWDMYQLGDKWHFFVEEIDPGSESSKTITASSSFSSSWEVGGSGGIDIGIVKIGASAKSQGSSSNSRSETVNIKISGGSDDLGSAILEYTDKISLGYKYDVNPWHEAHDIHTINTGILELGIVPIPKY